MYFINKSMPFLSSDCTACSISLLLKFVSTFKTTPWARSYRGEKKWVRPGVAILTLLQNTTGQNMTETPSISNWTRAELNFFGFTVHWIPYFYKQVISLSVKRTISLLWVNMTFFGVRDWTQGSPYARQALTTELSPASCVINFDTSVRP